MSEPEVGYYRQMAAGVLNGAEHAAICRSPASQDIARFSGGAS